MGDRTDKNSPRHGIPRNRMKEEESRNHFLNRSEERKSNGKKKHSQLLYRLAQLSGKKGLSEKNKKELRRVEKQLGVA